MFGFDENLRKECGRGTVFPPSITTNGPEPTRRKSRLSMATLQHYNKCTFSTHRSIQPLPFPLSGPAFRPLVSDATVLLSASDMDFSPTDDSLLRPVRIPSPSSTPRSTSLPTCVVSPVTRANSSPSTRTRRRGASRSLTGPSSCCLPFVKTSRMRRYSGRSVTTDAHATPTLTSMMP